MKLTRRDLLAAIEREEQRFGVTPHVAFGDRGIAGHGFAPVVAGAVAAVLLIGGIAAGIRSIAHPLSTSLASHGKPARWQGGPPNRSGITDVPGLFYAIDPSAPSTLIAFDWNGKQVGTSRLAGPLKLLGTPLAQGGTDIVEVSSDGQRILLNGTVYDPSLHQLGAVDFGGKGSNVIWSSDHQVLCGVRELGNPNLGQPLQVWVYTQRPGAADHDVRLLATYQQQGVFGFNVAGCSTRTNLVVVYRYVTDSTSDIWVLRLSDGSVAYHDQLAPGAVGAVFVSAGADLIAENRTMNSSGTTSSGVVVDPVRGSTIARVAGGILALSPDGKQAIVRQPNAGPAAAVELLDLRSGKVLWREALDEASLDAVWSPDGAHVLVVLYGQCGANGCGSQRLTLISSAGSANTLRGTYYWVPVG